MAGACAHGTVFSAQRANLHQSPEARNPFRRRGSPRTSLFVRERTAIYVYTVDIYRWLMVRLLCPLPDRNRLYPSPNISLVASAKRHHSTSEYYYYRPLLLWLSFTHCPLPGWNDNLDGTCYQRKNRYGCFVGKRGG